MTTQPTFLNDAAEKTAETARIGETVKIGEAERTEGVVAIAAVTRRGESVRSAGEKTESVAAARTAATS